MISRAEKPKSPIIPNQSYWEDMRLTSLADYAVVMMAAAARHPAGARLSATLLAAETGIPLPTAQKLTGRLAAAGLLQTARGTGGGFRLSRLAPERLRGELPRQNRRASCA